MFNLGTTCTCFIFISNRFLCKNFMTLFSDLVEVGL